MYKYYRAFARTYNRSSFEAIFFTYISPVKFVCTSQDLYPLIIIFNEQACIPQQPQLMSIPDYHSQAGVRPRTPGAMLSGTKSVMLPVAT